MERARTKKEILGKGMIADMVDAFLDGDREKMQEIREEALEKGMCVNKDGLCEPDYCKCHRDY